MGETTAHAGDEKKSGVSRRTFVKTVGASGAIAGVTGYTGRTIGRTQATTLQWAGSQVDKQNADAINNALHEAGLSQDIRVNFIVTSDITDDVQSQYQQWLSANRNKPDIMRMDSGWTIPFIARNQLYNLSQNMSQDVLDRINQDNFKASVSTAKAPNGDLFAVPYFTDLPTIQYRKDLVTDAGYDPDGESWGTEPMSWKRFSEIISDVQGKSSNIEHGYAWQANVYEGLSCCTFNELMTSWGGAYFGGRENLFGPIGDRPITVDEQPVIDAIKMGRAFIHGSDDQQALDGYQQISPQATLQWTEGPSQSAFVEGNAVALRYWPSGIFDAHQRFGDDLGVMPIPYGVPPEEANYEGTGGSSPALGGWNLGINPNSANTDAAVQVLEAVAQPSFRQFTFSKLGYIPSDATLLRSQEAQNVDVWGNYVDTLRMAGENAIPRPVTVVWPNESTQIAQHVNGALARQQAPDQAMSSLKSALKQIEQSV